MLKFVFIFLPGFHPLCKLSIVDVFNYKVSSG